MNNQNSDIDKLRFDLLHYRKNEILSLKEIESLGTTFFKDRFAISLYNLKPNKFIEKKCKLICRSAIECQFDLHSIAISKAIKDFFYRKKIKNLTTVDLFAGTGNLLYHITKEVEAKQSVAFEINPNVYNCTKNNFKIINFNSKLFNITYSKSFLKNLSRNNFLLIIIAPPWGNAFSFEKGLNLLKTTPSYLSIMKKLELELKEFKKFYMLLSHEHTEQNSINTIKENFNLLLHGTTNTTPHGTNNSYMIFENKR